MKLSETQKKQKWIVAVSGGSDSMALLHMCLQEKIPMVVAHMNYQKRASAQRDSDGVKKYCEMHQIPFELRYQQEPCQKNFQAFAREKRYAFFHELTERYQAQGVLVAHQLDDHLETYLMQRQKGILPTAYGLREQADIFGCHVVRPLLDDTKQELEAYCIRHCVPYWLDESNLSDQYMRNRIRHTLIDNMSDEEKQRLKQEIAAENHRHQQYQKTAEQFLAKWEHDCASLMQQDAKLQVYILHQWIAQACNKHISKKEIRTLQALLKQSRHWVRPCGKEYEIRMEYGKLSAAKSDQTGYAYTLNKLTFLTTPYFTLSDHGTVIEGVTLSDSDFPITIRSYQQGDAISLRFGTKKLNRWFIDRKIPLQQRNLWPVMVNAQGKVIFAAKIGCDIEHFSNNPSAFVLK